MPRMKVYEWSQLPTEKLNDPKALVDGFVKDVHGVGMTPLGFANNPTRNITIYILFAGYVDTVH